MEGNVTERRLSVAVTPLWLDSSNTSIVSPSAAVTHENINREVSPRPETTEEGLPPNKVQIQATEMPRIQLPTRHRGVTETFENTEVEELIAMLRETENLEDQGDILQYLVDTQGLDYNTGKYHNYHPFKGSYADGKFTSRLTFWRNCSTFNWQFPYFISSFFFGLFNFD